VLVAVVGYVAVQIGVSAILQKLRACRGLARVMVALHTINFLASWPFNSD
jgi:hypothetical protein